MKRKTSKQKTPKVEASDAMRRYVRLRDALAYCDKYSIDTSQFTRPEDLIGQCCTCGVVKSWIRMDAGHWIGRGIGGGSGVYFDERNVNLQCKLDNMTGGKPQEHEDYIREKHGQEVIDELRRKHVLPLDMSDLAMKSIKIFYDDGYRELLKRI